MRSAGSESHGSFVRVCGVSGAESADDSNSEQRRIEFVFPVFTAGLGESRGVAVFRGFAAVWRFVAE